MSSISTYRKGRCHEVRLGGFQYEIGLLQIGYIQDEAHSWPWYEFEVTQYLPILPADDA
jgi:hypothetical protein